MTSISFGSGLLWKMFMSECSPFGTLDGGDARSASRDAGPPFRARQDNLSPLHRCANEPCPPLMGVWERSWAPIFFSRLATACVARPRPRASREGPHQVDPESRRLGERQACARPVRSLPAE